MITSIDHYLDKKYVKGKYNCAHFAAEVWYDLTGKDIKPFLVGILPDSGSVARHSLIKNFTRLKSPVSPCLVLLTHKIMQPHAGVFLFNRVLHLTEAGVRFATLDSVSYGMEARFYRC